jgi:glycosyltransferase involved in cell wall biosynthesis
MLAPLSQIDQAQAPNGRKMRILQIVSGGAPNGAVLQCLELTRRLAQRGHELTVVCRPNAWIAGALAGDPVEVVRSDMQRWPPAELRRIASLMQNRRIQISHTHMSRAHNFGVLLRWVNRTPCVATAHNRLAQMHWFLNDYVIANSYATLHFHQRWNRVSAARSTVVPYLIDLSRFETISAAHRRDVRATWGLSDETPLLGIIGDVCQRKGQMYLVRALPEILSVVPTTRLVVMGHTIPPEYKTRVVAEAERLGVSRAILWRPFKDDISGLMSALDLCVSASTEEALGLTIPEAMAAGRAVVGTNVGGIPENVVHGHTGLLVPPANPGQLASAIIELLTDPERRARMGRAAYQRVHRMYNADWSVNRIETIYALVITRGLKRSTIGSRRSSPAPIVNRDQRNAQ